MPVVRLVGLLIVLLGAVFLGGCNSAWGEFTRARHSLDEPTTLEETSGRSLRRKSRQRVAKGQGNQWVQSAAVGYKVPIIRIQRASPPTARFPLIVQQPGNAPLKAWIVGRQTRSSQSHDREARHVSVARRIRELGLGPQLFGAIALAPLIRRRKGPDRPAAVRSLVTGDHRHQLASCAGVQQTR